MKSDNLPDDISLASGLRKGDREAFALFFNKYRKPVYYFSLKYLNDPAEAEELVQSVFLASGSTFTLLTRKNR